MIATLLELTYNLALLVALSVISGFIRQRRRSAAWGPILQGVLFGGAAVIGMMKPLVLGPGLIFDGRSVMLSLCGLFFGPVAAGVAGGLALLYRIYLGGPGVYMGVLVIASSALLGLAFHQRWVCGGQSPTVVRLWGLGLLVHVVMLLLMFSLPAGSGLVVIKRLGLPILVAYPLVTILIGQVLSSQAAGMRAVEALRMTRFSIENASDAMYWLTPEARIVDVNEAACRLLGYTRNELLRLTVPDVDANYDAKRWPEHFAEIRQFGSRTFESQHCHRDGRLIPVEVVANYVKFGEEERNCAFVRDITARKQAEEALHHSEQKFRTLFENMTEGVALHELVINAAGKVLDYQLLAVNPAYEAHTGLAAATAPGLLGTEIYGTEEPPYLTEFSHVALGGEPYVFETYFSPLDKHFRISVISPKTGQFATVFEDITERKRSEEELKQKNAEMERFTYMISHDLKSPLVTVRTFLGYLEQDLEQGKAERVAKDMGFIRNATGKMGRLLEDLLEVSRVGRVVNPPVQVSLPDLIADALAAVAGSISSRGVAIRVAAPAIMLFGDRPRLEEIWQNLVENAVKYMGEQPAPCIELGAKGTGVDTIFYVSDNGIGIDPKFQDRVFGLFEQLDAASEGTGLGLALVKRIVELNEGRIWLESEGVGRGTCFRFTLPLALKGRAKEKR